ncbi:hypothetical protein MRB53_019827 [Persea americana]|uniref:Uncharacterized protein n=1 Tax=Persea americana TaxID=3435 RepID=A0ACC2KZA9_PERAE|nr:hypothetical protein MRB53_019827 [Persea americana]
MVCDGDFSMFQCHFEFAGVFMMMKVLSTDYELHFASPVFILLQVLLHCYLWFVMEFENQHIPVYVGAASVLLMAYIDLAYKLGDPNRWHLKGESNGYSCRC